LRCKKLGKATFTAQTAAAVAAALAAGAPAQQQLKKLQELLQQLLLQEQGDVTAVKPGAAVAAAGSTAAAVLPHNQQADPTAAAPMECDSDNGLPLPAQLLQAVVCCCDSRTAAAAAASCKQLRVAVAAQQFLQVSTALQIYLAAVKEASGSSSTIDGDYVGIDGDIEEASQADSSFVGQFPLDGSAVAGADLVGGYSFFPSLLLRKRVGWIEKESQRQRMMCCCRGQRRPCCICGHHFSHLWPRA
jgi:hypothetical protein